jgi:hypothetical protein
MLQIESNDHDKFAIELGSLINAGKFTFLSEEQLEENFDVWASAAAEAPVSDEEKEAVAERIGSLALDHGTRIDHIPATIASGLLTTLRFRTANPDLFPTTGFGRLGSRIPFEKPLGLDDYICTSFANVQHIPSDLQFRFNALEMLRRPGTLVFPYDAPFLHVGFTPTLSEDINLQQQIALRGTDYLEILPTYMAMEARRGDENKAGNVWPSFLKEKFWRPYTYRSSEIKILGNIALDEVAWTLQVHTALEDHAELVAELPEDVRMKHLVDNNGNNRQ